MALQNYRIVFFISFRAILEDDHIVVFVLDIAKIMFLGKRNQKITDLFGIARALRNGAKLLKIIENRLRFEAGKFTHTHKCTPCVKAGTIIA